MSNQHFHNDDEFVLSKFWNTFVKRKLIIFLFTGMMTTGAIIYAWTITPMYTGHILIQIGEVIFNADSKNDKPILILPIQNITNLSQVLIEILQVNAKPNPEAMLIQVDYQDINKNTVQKKLQQVTKLVLEQYQQKVNFYQKVPSIIRPTLITSNIDITPVKKRLIIIIGFLNGLIFSLFLVLFIEFIQTSNNKRSDSN